MFRFVFRATIFGSKIISLAVLFSILLPVSCGKYKDRSLSNIEKRGYVIVGIDDTCVPFSFVDKKSNEMTGFNVDCAKIIGDGLGVKTLFRSVPAERYGFSVNRGDVDIVIGVLTDRDISDKKIIQSPPLAVFPTVIISKPKKNITDIGGCSIGVIAGSQEDNAIARDGALRKSIRILRRYKTVDESFRALETGKIDAMLTDSMTASFNIALRNKKGFIARESAIGKTGIAAVFKNGDKALMKKVKKIIKENETKIADIRTEWADGGMSKKR